MKKAICGILIFALVLGLCSCGERENSSSDSSSSENYPEHQYLTNDAVDFNYDTMLRLDIPEVGLENLFIREKTALTQIESETYGEVYLLGDDRWGRRTMPSAHYLAVVTDGKLIVKDIFELAAYSGKLYLNDCDGDGDNEITVQETVAMTGGAGQYLSRVFDFKSGEINEVFTSRVDGWIVDTGFTGEIMKNKKLKIKNRFTGFSKIINFSDIENEDYFNWWYDENGEIIPRDIMVDSFFEFIPVDIDGDGVFEIKGKQYVSLIGHANGIGAAISYFSYNNEKGKFEIIKSDFETFK